MKTEPPIIHKERFEAWLLSQPDERHFDYTDNHNCLVCMFLKENTSLSKPMVDPYNYFLEDLGEPSRLPGFVTDMLDAGRMNESLDCISVDSFYTFGSMKRAWRKMFPESLSVEPQPAPLISALNEGKEIV